MSRGVFDGGGKEAVGQSNVYGKGLPDGAVDELSGGNVEGHKHGNGGNDIKKHEGGDDGHGIVHLGETVVDGGVLFERTRSLLSNHCGYRLLAELTFGYSGESSRWAR